MSEARQNIPMLVMWERVLRIRQQLYDKEGSSSVYAREGVLARDAVGLENIQEELMRRVMMSETLDMPFDQWDSFNQWPRTGSSGSKE